MFNKITLIGRLGQNAEARTAQNKNEFVGLSIATQESWKNDKGDSETRTEWHRVYAWRISRSSPGPPEGAAHHAKGHSGTGRSRPKGTGRMLVDGVILTPADATKKFFAAKPKTSSK